MSTQTLPHQRYIDAVEEAFTKAQMQPEQVDAHVEDSYDIPFLRGTITLTPETSGYSAERYQHGLLIVWDWHTGRDEYAGHDRGPVWQWARINDDGSNQELQELPVPGWAAPAMLAGSVATLAHTGTATPMRSEWGEQWIAASEAGIRSWELGQEATA